MQRFPSLSAVTRSVNAPGSVSLHFGDGQGGFGPVVAAPIDQISFGILLTDLNADGDVDLAVRRSDGVSVRYGDGQGGFSGAAEVLVASVDSSLAAADLDGDGRLDLATLGFIEISVLLADGLGGFTVQRFLPGNEAANVTILDANMDGRPDLVTSCFDGNAVSVLLHAPVCPAFFSLCYGDGTFATCPCSNAGLPGHGCDNSAGTGGAALAASGSTSADTVVLTSSGELSTALSIFLQGNAKISAAVFGDGLRCTGGSLKRLYVHNASGGIVSAPVPGEPSIRVRSAALGDSILVGETRFYQVYYRDPALGFCPMPPGNSWNVSSALQILWP